MSDLINRQAAIDALAKAMPSLTTPDGSGEFDHDIQITDEAFVDCMQIINELPSAQSEIIYCKDCRWWDREAEDLPMGYCHACKHSYYSSHWEIRIIRTYKENFFCADAEPKEDE